MAVKGRGKVVEKDMGWNDLMKRMNELSGGMFVRVGVVGDMENSIHRGEISATTGKSDVTTNVKIGSIHEFGSADGKIPERSHLRSTLDEEKEVLTKMIEATLQKATRRAKDVRTLDWKKMFGRLGLQLLGDVKRKIQSGIEPELKYRDGTPLIDTGQYINSLTFDVKKGNK